MIVIPVFLLFFVRSSCLKIWSSVIFEGLEYRFYVNMTYKVCQRHLSLALNTIYAVLQVICHQVRIFRGRCDCNSTNYSSYRWTRDFNELNASGHVL